MHQLLLPSFPPQLFRQHPRIEFTQPRRRPIIHNAVIAIRQRRHLQLRRTDPSPDQSIHQGRSILVVHVIIPCAVRYCECTRKIEEACGVPHGGLVVPGLVVRERLHVALGVEGVVEAPVGNGGAGDAEGEDRGVGFDYFGGEVAAVKTEDG